MINKITLIKIINRFTPYTDICLVPFVYLSAWLLRTIRKAGIQNLPFCKNVLLGVGVFPITNHYYEPQFDMRNIKHSFSDERKLSGIDWNIKEQLQLLDQFIFSQELKDVPIKKTNELQFYFDNSAFKSGDAEFWYQMIRLKKPKKIFEVGSGNSTLMAIDAIKKNQQENPEYKCKHVCIEPYEMPWLEKTGVIVLRKKIEDVEVSFFSELEEDDFLFIDSSHMIRPEGDVLFEYLELIPSLNQGVIVHLHDIFSPRNYLKEWLNSKMLFWNEQYLLEAFLCHNNSWKIVGALNYLHHNHFTKLKKISPFLTPDREPGSFYIQKIA